MSQTPRLLTLFFLCLLLPSSLFARKRDGEWFGDKYSMFVHYGLYSTFGGVFDGKPVKEGYSEQILTFGIGFSDWYEEAALDFTAKDFDADAIVALAKANGMRSVVLTTKHHDGFCLFRTATTTYNSFDGTPAHRDLVREMSDACHRAGMGFGVYFSLIDWHYPYAVPFSSHNADAVTPLHHEYNIRQVTELLTNYGRVDELWFDMGSLTEEQSAELYALVHRLQPQCMISGRLGNDYADFSVMPDNALPDYPMDHPWQTAASIFPETWGYRSWQDRSMPVEEKAKEKMQDLIRVVTLGGKYLLNIGPMGSGAVVPYERQVLEKMATFIEPVKEAIYGTFPATFTKDATLSPDGRCLYIFVKEGTDTVSLPPLTASPLTVHTLRGRRDLPFTTDSSGALRVTSIPSEGFPTVVCLTFDSPVSNDLSHQIHKANSLSTRDATPLFTHSSGDYYASFKAPSGYRWVLPKVDALTLRYAECDTGKTISIDGTPITLLGGNPISFRPPLSLIQITLPWSKVPSPGLFGSLKSKGEAQIVTATDPYSEMRDTISMHSGMLYTLRLNATEAVTMPVCFTFSDGIIVALNDKVIDGAIQRTGDGSLTLFLPLRAGENKLVVKSYNLSSSTGAAFRMAPLSEVTMYDLPLQLRPVSHSTSFRTLEIKRLPLPPLMAPAHLSTLFLLH